MERIRLTRVANKATNVRYLGARAHFVQREPAVQKPSRNAHRDVIRAGKSSVEAGFKSQFACLPPEDHHDGEGD